MRALREIVRRILPRLARVHPKNWTGPYPQLWYCWPDWTRRYRNPRVYQLRTQLCAFLTGHEISETEWGYGGGDFVDRHCRWCDVLIKLPKREEIVPDILNGLVGELGYWDFNDDVENIC